MIETNEEQRRFPRVLAAELVITELLLALGLQEMLNRFEFDKPIYWPSFFVLLGLAILVIWYAQLLVSLKAMFEGINPQVLPLGGLIHLWIQVPYAAIIYLACRYQKDYPLPLVFITIVVVLDILSSTIDCRLAKHEDYSNINGNWVIRDMLLLPMIAFAWFIYFQIDSKNPPSPSPLTGIFFLIGMIFAYLFDMWVNGILYQTYGLWHIPVKLGQHKLAQALAEFTEHGLLHLREKLGQHTR